MIKRLIKEARMLSCRLPVNHQKNFFIILFLTAGVLINPPINAFGADRKVWSSREIGVRFSYDNRWTEATPTQDSTVVAINWLSKKSNGLMATCYLQVSNVSNSGLGMIDTEDIHDQAEFIAESVKNNTSKRSDDYKRLILEKKFVDNYPVIYLVQLSKIKSFDEDYYLTIYSIITSWEKMGIMFSCGTEITNKFPQYKEPIEKQIVNVLRTLQFDRK